MWNEWFAWFPVKTVSGRSAWLRTVIRKKVTVHSDHMGNLHQYFVYRETEVTLKKLNLLHSDSWCHLNN